MKIQYLSDLHLEFQDNLNWIDNNPIQQVGDILIIAGDLLPFVSLSRTIYKSEIANLCRNFKKVFWIPGNHEYYLYTHHYADTRCEQPLKEVPNLFLVDNYTERIERTQLIMSTMWSHIGRKNASKIQRGMSDFHYITVQNPEKDNEIESLEVSDFNHFNNKAIRFLKKEVKKATQAKKAGEIDHIVVATHYVPTLKNYPEIYLGSVLNEAFALELSDFIVKSKIDYWIYGHHHFNQPDFKIGNTNLITNQLGYVMREENEGFEWEKCILL
ncbi:MAG: metallophosphoesterase [Capnocytophaga sp.]|nr:metallophosphoesterase [Capnocytophaga sp.]